MVLEISGYERPDIFFSFLAGQISTYRTCSGIKVNMHKSILLNLVKIDNGYYQRAVILLRKPRN